MLVFFFPCHLKVGLSISLECSLCVNFLYYYSTIWVNRWFGVNLLFSDIRLISCHCFFACSEMAVKHILEPPYLSFIVYIFKSSLSLPHPCESLHYYLPVLWILFSFSSLYFVPSIEFSTLLLILNLKNLFSCILNWFSHFHLILVHFCLYHEFYPFIKEI